MTPTCLKRATSSFYLYCTHVASRSGVRITQYAT